MYSNANQHDVESTDVFMAYASSTSSRSSDCEDKEWGVVFALNFKNIKKIAAMIWHSFDCRERSASAVQIHL